MPGVFRPAHVDTHHLKGRQFFPEKFADFADFLKKKKNLGDIDSIVQKWNLDHNENASCRMYITHEGDSLCIVQKNGYKIQAQILVNH